MPISTLRSGAVGGLWGWGELFKSCQERRVTGTAAAANVIRLQIGTGHHLHMVIDLTASADLRETDKDWDAFTSQFIVLGVYENRTYHLYIITKACSSI